MMSKSSDDPESAQSAIRMRRTITAGLADETRAEMAGEQPHAILLQTVVGSSNVVSAGYNERTHTFAVVYRGNSERMYLYQGVPVDVVERFWSSFSKGRYLAHHIKTHYAYTIASDLAGTPEEEADNHGR